MKSNRRTKLHPRRPQKKLESFGGSTTLATDPDLSKQVQELTRLVVQQEASIRSLELAVQQKNPSFLDSFLEEGEDFFRYAPKIECRVQCHTARKPAKLAGGRRIFRERRSLAAMCLDTSFTQALKL